MDNVNDTKDDKKKDIDNYSALTDEENEKISTVISRDTDNTTAVDSSAIYSFNVNSLTPAARTSRRKEYEIVTVSASDDENTVESRRPPPMYGASSNTDEKGTNYKHNKPQMNTPIKKTTNALCKKNIYESRRASGPVNSFPGSSAVSRSTLTKVSYAAAVKSTLTQDRLQNASYKSENTRSYSPLETSPPTDKVGESIDTSAALDFHEDDDTDATGSDMEENTLNSSQEYRQIGQQRQPSPTPPTLGT